MAQMMNNASVPEWDWMGDYFDYLCNLICMNDGTHDTFELATIQQLHQMLYYYSLPIDSNLESYALQRRREWQEANNDFFVDPWDGGVSVLEALIALAGMGEANIFWDPDMGNRTQVWFWTMFSKLHLDRIECGQDIVYIVERWLNRQFMPNGEGSCCGPLRIGTEIDMRQVTFWMQFQYWAGEYFTFDTRGVTTGG